MQMVTAIFEVDEMQEAFSGIGVQGITVTKDYGLGRCMIRSD